MKKIRTVVVKQGVSVKLKLPKNFQWKVLAKLSQELGFSGQYIPEFLPFQPSTSVDLAIRQRSSGKLKISTDMFRPQSMADSDDGADTFFARYQLASFLAKYPEKGIDTRQVALDKFLKTEDTCSLFNKENYRALEVLDQKHPDFLGCLDQIRNDISDLLGESPNLSLVGEMSKHGPGVSYIGELYAGGKVTNFYKWSKLPYSVTHDAYTHAKKVILDDPRWIGALDDEYRRRTSNLFQPIDMGSFWDFVLKVVEGSRLTTVPKSAETDRTICIEPLINVFLQLGVDGVIRGRLKSRWGVNLNDQTLNQVLAKEASISGEFATVDLSSASDLISLKVCELLLPAAWYDLLHDLRSHNTEIDGRWVALEKISSMGNGYTFALESVIFSALTRYAIKKVKAERRYAVYGDDIVIPVKAFPILKDILQLCGFSINEKKTFVAGPFRESCGTDYYRGIDVRPVFLKSPIQTIPDLFYLHNVLWKLQKDKEWPIGLVIPETLDYVKQYVPLGYRRCFGPASESLDTYLFSDKRIPRLGTSGCSLITTIKPVPRTRNKRYEDWYFVKLMKSLRGNNAPPPYRWDKKNVADTGNAFDITERDRVTYNLTLSVVYTID